MVRTTAMTRCALESPDLGQPFKYLERSHITRRKFLKDIWSKKITPKVGENSKISRFSSGSEKQDFVFGVLRLSFKFTILNVLIWCVIDSPDLEQPFKYFERAHISHRKILRAIWRKNVLQKLMKTQESRESHLDLCFHQFLTNALVSDLL